MSKKTKTSVYFPEEIILQILHKLPIKSLVRFTCVSKSWLSLIKNPNFISNHLKLSISCSNKNPLLLLCINSFRQNLCNLYFDKQGYNHYVDLHFPSKTHKYNFGFIIVGTINGLVCVVDSLLNTKSIIIWNPLIKKSFTLPKPSAPTCYDCASYGFGFDSRSNDYKVLRLARRSAWAKVEEQDSVEAEIYSLNTNSWKRICAPRCEIKWDNNNKAFVNGVMHVLAIRRHKWDSKCPVFILGFDIGAEVFKEIALPQSLANAHPVNLNVLVYKESIAVFQREFVCPSGRHLWVMEQYGVVQSWTKMLSFQGPERELPTMLGFRKNGELFLRIHDGEIVSCDPESRENKSLGVSGRCLSIDYFVESLELLDNANAQSDPTVENDAIEDAAGDATAAND